MNTSIKVSVIVPMYNAEKHLHQCLDSILEQSLKEIEIICVDDGSTDSTLQILNSYANVDSRIKIIHQNNLFAGAARNAGKAIAQGKYLIFWDADDFFYVDALKNMYDQSEQDNADICVCGVDQYLDDIQETVSTKRYMNPKKIPDTIPFNRNSNPNHILNFTTEATWNKMYRRSFIERLQLDFQPVRNGNDVYFVINALCLADSITVIEKPLLCYRKNQTTSLVGTLHKSPITPLQAWCDACNNLIEHNAFPEKSFVNKVLGVIFYLLRNMSTWQAFQEAMTFLQNEGLQTLHIQEQPTDYYYTDWHAIAVTHLLNDKPEEFLTYLSHTTYIQMVNASAKRNVSLERNKKLRKELEKAEKKLANNNQIKNVKTELETVQKQLNAIKNSKSYKLGRIITAIPRKIIQLIKHN